MNTSDVIAIVAISVSALVTIIVAITSYRSNKLNIQARPSEMAFEKQIEAFREIADKMGGIRKAIISSHRYLMMNLLKMLSFALSKKPILIIISPIKNTGCIFPRN